MVKYLYAFTRIKGPSRGVNHFQKSVRDQNIFGVFLGFLLGFLGFFGIFSRFFGIFWIFLWDFFRNFSDFRDFLGFSGVFYGIFGKVYEIILSDLLLDKIVQNGIMHSKELSITQMILRAIFPYN